MYKAIVVLIIAFIVWGITFPRITADSVIIKPTDKERIVKASGESVSSKHLVFTEEEVFENTDSIYVFKFNSSDIQGKIKVNETYKADVYGWRIPIFSSYRNITNVEIVNPQGKKYEDN